MVSSILTNTDTKYVLVSLHNFPAEGASSSSYVLRLFRVTFSITIWIFSNVIIFLLTIAKRRQWHNEAVVKFPTKVAIIVERGSNADPSLAPLANPKFLMPKAFSVGEVLSVVRSKLNMSKEKGLVLMESKGKYILKASHNIGDVYEQYKDEDGFLYLLYAQENIYGWKENYCSQLRESERHLLPSVNRVVVLLT